MGLVRALRDANSTLRRERDERVELVLLQRERFTWRVTAAVAVIGVLAVLAWPSLADHQRVIRMWWVLAVTPMVWMIVHAVAVARYGDVATPEMQRADALRSLILFPLSLSASGVVYWLMSRDLTETWRWLVIFGPVMSLVLYLRYRRTEASDDEES